MKRKKGLISIILATVLLLGMTGCDTVVEESPKDVVKDTSTQQENRKTLLRMKSIL